MAARPFYIKLLLNEIENRKEKNPRYSLRAFARYLGIGPSTLSRILSGRQELSHSACKNLIKKLKFNRDDCVLFIASIAEERKRRAYKLLFNIIEDSDDGGPNDSYEWLLSNTPDMMFVFDVKSRCIHANESAAQFFNILPENIIGKKMDQIGMQKDIADKIKDSLNAVFRNPRIEKVEECYEINGDNRCFEITLVPVGHAQNVRAVACHWRDITEKVSLERLWKTSAQIGEIISSQKDFQKALGIIAQELTEKYCEACIIKLPSKKILKVGKSELSDLYHEIAPKKNSREIHADKRVLTIPFITSSLKNVPSQIVLIRANDRSEFSIKDLELARDLQNRLQSCSA